MTLNFIGNQEVQIMFGMNELVTFKGDLTPPETARVIGRYADNKKYIIRFVEDGCCLTVDHEDLEKLS